MKESDIIQLVRENIKALVPYSSARDEFQGEASIFLDANENPFQSEFNRYPDPHQRQLKNVIGKIKNINTANIFIGNGSDEAIDLLLRIFCVPGKDRVIIPQPTYGMYQVSAGVNDVICDTVSLTKTFDLVSSAVLKSVRPETKIIFVCSPNNPSGNLFDPLEIEKILEQFNGIVVIDEAYIDFCDAPSWINRLKEFPNLVVLQTLSKAWGLASLRLGMAFANASIIALLDKVKAPYNISGLIQKTVIHQIEGQQDKKNKMVGVIRKEKLSLANALASLKVVTNVFPSDANFLLVQVTDARKVYDHLAKKGIIVRDRSNVRLCENCLRVSVGTEAENKRLIESMLQL
ncbi:MAG TPA: histidinol-phosphate transaminase [Cyclobacteriaceae bacterium]|nr:histidinol-phosphate transaminase [Cyclobacteriaceae bacterium]